MSWPPNIGEPLPRAAGIWFEQSKLEWILGAEGHGRSPHGVTCGVQVSLTIGDRGAKTLASWHYALEIAMIEVLEPELGPAARIVFAPLDKLRIVKPSSKSS